MIPIKDNTSFVVNAALLVLWYPALTLSMIIEYYQFVYYQDVFDSKLEPWLKKGKVFLGGVYGVSTFIGYITPNPFYVNNHFYFKQFSFAWVHNLIVKNISISNYSSTYIYNNSVYCKYSFNVKNSSISNKSV